MKSIEDYPVVMNAPQLAEFLGISKPKAYELMRQTDFPTIALGAELKCNKRVLRDDVIDWLRKQRRQGA